MYGPQSVTIVERYNATAQIIHWVTAVLVVGAYITSVGGSEARVYAPVTDFSRGLHELIGMSVFALTLAVGFIEPWLPQARQLGLALAYSHGWLGNVLIWLAGIHAAAALVHHFWPRDTVLRSMLPGR